MRVIGSAGREDIATVYLAETGPGRYLEFVESVQPPLPRSDKWVLIVSTMLGCPVGCAMCDAGGSYAGLLSAQEILAQIGYLVGRRFPAGEIAARKFKIQFARMGEPALNPAVLDVLRELPGRFSAPGLIPSVSSVAPAAGGAFFEKLLEIKRNSYSGGRFQLQFSVHTTSVSLRDRIIPASKWGFTEIAAYGAEFWEAGDRKITLNSALAEGMPLDAGVLRKHFDPAKFLIKITPINPTHRAKGSGLRSYIAAAGAAEDSQRYSVVQEIRQAGFEVIVSVGELEENLIGSNCGQYVRRHLAAGGPLRNSYIYGLETIPD